MTLEAPLLPRGPLGLCVNPETSRRSLFVHPVPLPSKCWGFLMTVSCLCLGHFLFPGMYAEVFRAMVLESAVTMTCCVTSGHSLLSGP